MNLKIAHYGEMQSSFIMETIKFFGVAESSQIEYGLSNFTSISVKIPKRHFPWSTEDLIFPHAEAAFQAFKCYKSKNDVQKFMTCDNPKKAKGIILKNAFS